MILPESHTKKTLSLRVVGVVIATLFRDFFFFLEVPKGFTLFLPPRKKILLYFQVDRDRNVET